MSATANKMFFALIIYKYYVIAIHSNWRKYIGV